MSKDEKKSSPSPNHGLPFDPSHLLGVHSLAAAGLPFPHLAHLSSPYSLLAQPPAFPGLFGGLGAIPNPLHAAALSHSLAAASYYGLPKHPSELASPTSPSASPSSASGSHKGGRSSRSPASSSTTATTSSSHRQSSSRSSPSSSSPHAVASVSPYLPSWAVNGSIFPFPHPTSTVADTKQTSSTSSSSPSASRRSRKSSGNSTDSRNSRKIPQAHQKSSTTSSAPLSIPTAHLSSSLSDSKSSAEKSFPEGFSFDPHSLITPYHMSPELAYLSQSLFLHRPDLGMPSPFLAASAAAAAAAAAAASSSSASSTTGTTTSSTAGINLEPGQVATASSTSSPKQSISKSSSSTISSSERSAEKHRSGRKHTEKSESSRSSSQRTHNGVGALGHDLRSREKDSAKEIIDDRLLADLSHPSHFMDDDRKKRIADHIRKRVGMHDSMAALLSKHGIKHSDWLEAEVQAGAKADEPKASSSRSSSRGRRDSESSQSGRRSKELEISEKIRLEAELQKQEEQLRTLQQKYSLGEESMAANLDESHDSVKSLGLSETEDSRLDHSSASDNLDLGSQSGTDSERSTPESTKRGADGTGDEGSPNKKRCMQLDERELTIPLEHGWNRQTIINGMGRRGIVGEVLYFAPCGKKMKTIPDVMRYLERNPNGDLGRENFSFNTKVNVGQFYETRGGQGSTPIPLTDTEVLEKIEMSRGKRARMQMLARKKREKAAREQALARQIMENKLKRRMELQVIEKRKEKEQHRMMKQQEKIRIQEQLRKERELRAQQIIEARNRRQKELEEMRLADAVQRNKEREMKRQQLIIMKEQERERRRQHLLLVKALEQRKKQEERQSKERIREERLNEKIKQKELRMHQRRIEMEVAMELKKPIEDMELKNAKPLPTYPRMKSRLAGKPIADCLMVVEFLNNFGVALNLDKSSVPTLESLERGLLSESEEDVEELMSLVMHLLRFALDDVGVPNPKEAVTKLNQKITEMEMTDTTMSEILRIFAKARGEKEMSEWLVDKPMEALNPTKKAAILAFLCNELLTSKVVTGEIDKHMDAINNLRRDKWIVEGQLRQLRVFQARKFNKIHKSTDRRNNSTTNLSSMADDDTQFSSKMGSEDEDEKEDDDDNEEGSGNESDGSSSVITSASTSSSAPFEPVDESLSREESDKRIEKLRKQHAAFRQKVFRASLRLRAIYVGQDRYKRMYWVLPLTGGVYVEGMESAVPEDYAKENEIKKEEAEEKKEGDNIKKEGSEITEEVTVENVKEEIKDGEKEEVKKEVDMEAKELIDKEATHSSQVNEKSEEDKHPNGKEEDVSMDSGKDQNSKMVSSHDSGFETCSAGEKGNTSSGIISTSNISQSSDSKPVLLPNATEVDISPKDALPNLNGPVKDGVEKEWICSDTEMILDDNEDDDGDDIMMGSSINDSVDKNGDESKNKRLDSAVQNSNVEDSISAVKTGGMLNGSSCTTDKEASGHGNVIKASSSDGPGSRCIDGDGRGPAETKTGASSSGNSQNGAVPNAAELSNSEAQEGKEQLNKLESSRAKTDESSSILNKISSHSESHSTVTEANNSHSQTLNSGVLNCVPLDMVSTSSLNSSVSAPIHKPSHTPVDGSDVGSSTAKPAKPSTGKNSKDVISSDKVLETSRPLHSESESEPNITLSHSENGCDDSVTKVKTDNSGDSMDSLSHAPGKKRNEAPLQCESINKDLNHRVKENEAFTGIPVTSDSDNLGVHSSAVSDILRVPKVGTGGHKETLVSLLNHSIQQAYQDQDSDKKTSRVPYSSSEIPSSSSASLSLLSASLSLPSTQDPLETSSILSSSLLFSAIPKLPQPAHMKKGPLQSPLTSTSTGSASEVLDFTPKSKRKHLLLDPPTPLLGSTPIPAHSKSPQPLPPFHPSAQVNPALDLTPPAAHAGHKSNKYSSLPPHVMVGPAPSPHLPQPPYIPGVSHHPYGLCSASETLSSLASIVSPPPAHHHPTTTTSTSSTPLLTPSLLPPHSTPSGPTSHSSFPKVDSILKGESAFSSSELLQQAASHVLRSAENKKLSPISSTSSVSSLSPSSIHQHSRLSASLLSSPPLSSAATSTTTLSTLTASDILAASTSSQYGTDQGSKSSSEVVDHKLWFSVLPRMPCDELSLSQPTPATSTPYYQPISSSTLPASSTSLLSASSSLSAISSYLTSTTSSVKLDSLLPFIQTNPTLLSQESLLTSLQLLTQPVTPSPSPTPCSTPGLDSGQEFKVPPPPDNPQSDPWALLRAAQGEAQPIPKNEQHGWWKIKDIAQLKAVMPRTLNRGIREKSLQRSIHRYLEYARLHCTYDSEKGETDPDAEPADDEGNKESEEEQERKTGGKSGSKKKEDSKKNKGKKEETKSEEPEEEVENEKKEDEKKTDENSDVVNVKDTKSETENNIQIKCEIIPDDDDNDDNKQDVKRTCDNKTNEDNKTDENMEESVSDLVLPDDPQSWSIKIMHEIEMAALEEVEALEERIFQASLQAKQGWRPNKDNNLTLVDRSVTEVSDCESYPLDVAISRLLELEANIERRYLKPPLIRSVQLNLSNLSSHSDRGDGDLMEDEDVPPGLLMWRQAVVGSESPAQLSLCTQLLAKSISWEKSIMRVTCQICRKDDNEAELLLCDGCDKGYHTYCFKPKMENIPEGDWYCFECVSKASGTPHCVVCGLTDGKIVSCRLCPRYIHLDCIDPPLPRMPKRWQCSNCVAEKANKRSRKKKESLPTVQRISITKLVIKEEPRDEDEYNSELPAASSSSGPAGGAESDKKGGSKSTGDKSAGDVNSQSGQKKRKRKEKDADSAPAATTATPPPPKKREKKEQPAKKERKARDKKAVDDSEKQKEMVLDEKKSEKSLAKDMTACGKLLTELEKHDDGWPFLKPVNKKQFPSYKKYIKYPMDFSTARGKLKTKEYKHRQEFAADMRLIFNNCETFNEDESEVGQAGYKMRQYFERRWLETFPDDAP